MCENFSGYRIPTRSVFGENVVNEIEIFRTAEFENEDEMRRLRMAEIGLLRGVIEDLFGEERIRLRSYKLLNTSRRSEWGFKVRIRRWFSGFVFR